MQGSVYQIVGERYGGQPHLYVVVLEFSGNQDCIVVPAFSADGYAVNEVIKARLDEGSRIDEIVVTLDNATYIQFTTHHTGKVAHWLVSDADRLLIADIKSYTLVGTMRPAGLQTIANGLLNFAPNTSRFSAAVLKKLRKLAEP
jgi:hypothetical protein